MLFQSCSMAILCSAEKTSYPAMVPYGCSTTAAARWVKCSSKRCMVADAYNSGLYLMLRVKRSDSS